MLWFRLMGTAAAMWTGDGMIHHPKNVVCSALKPHLRGIELHWVYKFFYSHNKWIHVGVYHLLRSHKIEYKCLKLVFQSTSWKSLGRGSPAKQVCCFGNLSVDFNEKIHARAWNVESVPRGRSVYGSERVVISTLDRTCLRFAADACTFAI